MIRVTYPFPMEEDAQTNKHITHLGTIYNVGRLIESKEIWIDIKIVSKGYAGILIDIKETLKCES